MSRAILLALCVVALSACSERSPAPGDSRARDDAVLAFLSAHWAQPRKAQGLLAAPDSAEHDALAPVSCGVCHRAQLEDWGRSLHSRAMGPGIAGQLVTMDAAERGDCQRCHAPLEEQADLRLPLAAQGLVCAGCHMRKDRVYGPVRRDGSTLAAAEGLPHGGWTASSAFEDSRFCGSCHQFEPDGYALNGKLLENTYEEWRASRHAREGRNCQSCHMPERRHLWRGIHDLDMTKSALALQPDGPLVNDGEIKATWQIANTGAGHFFPTYVTPRVIVAIRQETAKGETLPGTLQEHVIARQITPNLDKEVSDTRLAPDEKRVFDYRARHHPRAAQLVFEIRVEPDAFYTGLYRALLEEDSRGSGREHIAQALGDSLASRYTLYAERRALR